MRSILIILLLLLASAIDAQPQKNASILNALANSQHRLNFAVTAARLTKGINTERAYRDLDTMLSKEYGDMFWMYGMTGLYHTTKDLLHDSLKQKMMWAWKHLTPYRGDTENHFLMYYSSLFLMSEVWPNLEGSEWFTGQSSEEINRESREYLLHWIDQVAKYGLNEFDSPRYQYYFFTPVILLSQYALDPEVKKKSALLLELMLADYAVKYVKGNYAGAHSRTTEPSALTGTIGEVGAYGEYFFEDSVKNLQPDLGFVAMTGYECPRIIKQIAKEKRYPFELFESKRERPALRYHNSDKPVAKYTYIDSSYSIGSLQGGIVQPIQQQSWKLVFHDRVSPNTITGLHPYRSARELATYFPEEPSFQAERIEGTKAGYSSEDKWVGGSPFEQIYQDKNVLVAEYDIPPAVASQHSQLFIPKDAVWTTSYFDTIPAGVWLFFHFKGKETAVQFLHSSFVESREQRGTRYRSTGPKSGFVISVATETDTSHYHRVNLMKPLSSKAIGMRKRLRAQRQRDASRILYRSPYINAKRGSGVITLSFGKHKRILNFVTGRVREE
jgi:hypothetical protein